MSAEHDAIRLVWSYLTQPLFGPGYKSLNPFRFHHLYRLEQLEVTWMSGPEPEAEVVDELLEFLETCWLKNDLNDLKNLNTLKALNTEYGINAEFIQYLERCWQKNLSKPNGSLNGPDFWTDEEEYH